MESIGRPFVIQNTKRGWVVTWDNAVTVTDKDGDMIESVSFTVSIPRKAMLTIAEAQQFAALRAIELLQKLAHKPD